MRTRSHLPDRLIAIVLTAGIIGCASPQAIQLPPGGVAVDIVHEGGTLRNVELLAIQDDSVFVAGESFVSLPFGSIREVRLNIEVNRSWRFPVWIGNFLGGTILMALTDNTAQMVGVITWGVGVGAWAALEFSSPKTTFTFPLNEEDRSVMAMNARFPHGVEKEQLERLRTVGGGNP